MSIMANAMHKARLIDAQTAKAVDRRQETRKKIDSQLALMYRNPCKYSVKILRLESIREMVA